FLIGLALAGSLNVNTIAIANHLWADKPARDALVQRAASIAGDSAHLRALQDSLARSGPQSVAEELEILNLPIGWDHLPVRAPNTNTFNYVFQIVIGILVTALAVTLGAPFWFD